MTARLNGELSMRNTYLVARREVMTRLHSRTFLISMSALLVLVFLFMLLFGILSRPGGIAGPSKIAVTSEFERVQELQGLPVSIVDSEEDARRLVEKGLVDAAILTDTKSLAGVTLVAKQQAPLDVQMRFAVLPHVEILDSSNNDTGSLQMVGIAFGLIFTWTALSFGSTIAQSVVEEKQTRIVEILLSTLTSRTLLIGKIIGNTVLAMMTALLAIALSFLSIRVFDQPFELGDLGMSAGWFAILFLLGFILIATAYGALASMVSRQEEIGSVTAPLTFLVSSPYLLAVLFGDNPVALKIISYIPLSAPVGMPMRVYAGQSMWWEPIVSLVILLMSIVVMMLLGSLIYRNSILHMGSRTPLREALRLKTRRSSL